MPHRRANALSALIAGSVKLPNPARMRVLGELQQVASLRQAMPQNRRNLFQIIHAIRACDSSMACITLYYGSHLTSASMGSYLREFRNIAALPFNETHRQYYQSRLVRRRNSLMHEAGSYPAGRQEVIQLIDLMYACLSLVL